MHRLIIAALLAVLRLAPQLRTNAGIDWQARIMGDTASTGTGSYAPATWIALTANATAAAAGDTTLTAEIATASGGLIRKQGAYAHTNGTNTYTMGATFTVNGSDVVPVTVAKAGFFTASTAGTMSFETLLTPSTATLSAVGDAVTVTQTVTL